MLFLHLFNALDKFKGDSQHHLYEFWKISAYNLDVICQKTDFHTSNFQKNWHLIEVKPLKAFYLAVYSIGQKKQ